MGLLQTAGIVCTFLLWISCVYGDTIQCYQCRNCPVPFEPEKANKLANCNYCRTILNYGGGDRVTVEKECVVSCVDKDHRQGGRGIQTQCCSTDFCNPASRIAVNRKFLASVALILPTMIWKAVV
ncbi:unnamed protein product [Calicophoron daubneyi]|uniref:Snake toxin/toxin-like domain-containing protein n=1 Tax=Calicophoron daubneyi TaxID=300641 RepID=A0AAV2TY26_CALDB